MSGARNISTGTFVALGFIAIVTIVAPHMLNYYAVFLMTLIGAYVVGSQGLNVLMGFAGQISIGHAGFCAVGAYATALLNIKYRVPFELSLAVGIMAAALVGLVLGRISLSMAGPYLALTTIGFGIIVRIVILNWRAVTGGADGLTPLPPPRVLGYVADSPIKFYYLVMAFLWVVEVLVYTLKTSRVGRAMMALRDDPIAASCAGVDVTAFRLLAFVVSAALGAVSGVLIGYLSGGMFPDFFDIRLSSVFIVILAMGGQGTVLGPIIGSAIVVTGFEVMRAFREFQMVFYSLTVILVIMYMPQGLVSLFGKLGEMIAGRLSRSRSTGTSVGGGR